MKNLKIVKELLKRADDIYDIIPVGYDMVEIEIGSSELEVDLKSQGLLIDRPLIDETNIDDFCFGSDENSKTKQDCFDYIFNLINQQGLCESNQIYSDSDDIIIKDNKNKDIIMDKYNTFINTDFISSDSFSDSASDNLL